ncbi:hypothetical protein BEN42_14490 [Leptospira interrogans serovar Canicola]|nr:hypothetical protein B2G47_03755 [Leptospira interrogans serovar Canicola]EMN74532.1 hypothetical protein LEP1GSC102_3581 [Leptospira interrogans str. UI 09600]OQM29786.1 hypothetical protein DV30_13430 [Leptospira interrogans serovar Canicola str. Gui44]OQM31201.1 hypothetical protein DV38_07575 [Leptospira interrogans]ASV09511.1 hypothetical protein B2G50_14095 [Leptospira interrogans serovar Canicola]
MIEILELQTKHGKIKIIDDRSFQVGSEDNLHLYDYIYKANDENYYASTQFGIFTSDAQAILLRTCPKTLKNLDNSFLEIFNKTQ